jgi:type II secretory pathway pseudopilin PulG
MLVPRKLCCGQRGIALLESVMAIGLVGLFIAILLILSSNVLGLLRSSKDNMSVSHVLQQRLEQLRSETWRQLTNGEHLAAEPLALDMEASTGLSERVEKFTVSAYPPKAEFIPIQLVRQNGVTSLISDNAAMVDERMVRVDVSVKWRGFPNHRAHERAATIIIAQGSSDK